MKILEIQSNAHPILTKEGCIMCYSCYQKSKDAELEMWIPYQPDNFPCNCKECGLLMLFKELENI